jgi:hypothetical protein
MMLLTFTPQQYASALPLVSPWTSSVSTFLLSLDTVTVDQSAVTSDRTFDPILPDTNQILAFISIAALSAIAVYVWANEVVRH